MLGIELPDDPHSLACLRRGLRGCADILRKHPHPDLGTPCWRWRFATDKDGHGSYRYRGRYVPAHVLSWLVHGNDLPADYTVEPVCGNPTCINPEHLEPVSYESRVIADQRAGIRKPKRTAADMLGLRAGLKTILAVDNPMTVRQVFYQAVSRGLVEKTEAAYKTTVGRLLVDMRREGEVPYSWIADNTRWMRKPTTYSSLEEAIDAMQRHYRRAVWDEQDVYIEVWTEKDALAGVIQKETSRWDVPLMVSRGFASESYLYEAAETIKSRGPKPAYLYYFGDHDPSGVHIDRDIQRRLERMAPSASIHFERIAVLPRQIADWDLPTRPTKTTDARSKGFWGESVEVDAIPPARLRQLVRECIERHLDLDLYNRIKAAEEAERRTLASLKGWPGQQGAGARR
jgi:hypothetical protein